MTGGEKTEWTLSRRFLLGASVTSVAGHHSKPTSVPASIVKDDPTCRLTAAERCRRTYAHAPSVTSTGSMLMFWSPDSKIQVGHSWCFYIGLGETFDGDKVKAYPPGSVIVLPGETWHFHGAKSG